MINKILVVGLGSIGKRHVGILREYFPSIEIIVLRHAKCDEEQTKKFGISYCVTSIVDAIELAPQAAIISNPASKHLNIAIKLAKAKIHLLIEKPISDSSQGVEELINICLDKKIVLMCAYNLRFLPCLIAFKKYVYQLKVGKILTVNANVGSFLPSWRPGREYSKTVSAQKSLGGGVLLELSHEIDYLSWIFGKVNWVKSNVTRQSNLNIDTEDLVNVILCFDNLSNTKIIGTLNMDFFRHDTVRKCEVIGEDGTLVLNFLSGEIKFFSSISKHWEVLYSSIESRDFSYIQEIKNFFMDIDDKNLLNISGKDGLETLKAVEAIKKSSRDNSIIYL